jgi:hypothetical protein
MAQPKLGTIVTKDYRGTTIHTYNSPEEGLFVSS